MKKLSLISGISIVVLFLASSCYQEKKTERTDTTSSGIAEIVVDECLAPIIEEQISVFEALNPNATIIPTYTNDHEAYNLLFKDSMRVIVGTRQLTDKETAWIKSRKQRVWCQKLAVDGIAIITNQVNPIERITTADLAKIFTGQFKSWKEIDPQSKLDNISVVFDSPNSSTVRFIHDSICNGQQLGNNIKAISKDTANIDIYEKTPNQKVIDYVTATPNAMGIIGVNWISNPSDSLNLSFINNIKVLAISKENIATEDNSYQPYPYQFALQQYPLQRNVYIIITDIKGGLPSGFVTFAVGERGQRIILKAGLLPATQLTRLVRVNHNKSQS